MPAWPRLRLLGLMLAGLSSVACSGAPTAPSPVPAVNGAWTGTIVVGDRSTSVRLTLLESSTLAGGLASIDGPFSLTGALGDVSGNANGGRLADVVTLTLVPSVFRVCSGFDGVELGVVLLLRLAESALHGTALIQTCGSSQQGTVDLRRQ